MIKISELQEYAQKYAKRKKKLLEKDTIPGLIEFIDQEQKKKGHSVITLEKRETTRRLKELEERQEANKPFDPEEDFKNLE